MDYTALKKIADRLDPDEIVDRLGLSSSELVLLLQDQILDQIQEFYDVTDTEEDNE